MEVCPGWLLSSWVTLNTDGIWGLGKSLLFGNCTLKGSCALWSSNPLAYLGQTMENMSKPECRLREHPCRASLFILMRICRNRHYTCLHQERNQMRQPCLAKRRIGEMLVWQGLEKEQTHKWVSTDNWRAGELKNSKYAPSNLLKKLNRMLREEQGQIEKQLTEENCSVETKSTEQARRGRSKISTHSCSPKVPSCNHASDLCNPRNFSCLSDFLIRFAIWALSWLYPI